MRWVWLLLVACRPSDPSATRAESKPATGVASVARIEATDVSLQDAYGCIRQPSGKVACWGRNAGGEVGDGTSIPNEPFSNVRAAPTLVKGDVPAGALHTSLGLTWVVAGDGSTTAWGTYQFVIDSDVKTWVSLVPKPLDVPPLTQLVIGYGVMCAVDTGGIVRCAGNGPLGELGDGHETGGGSWGHADFRLASAVGHAEQLLALGHDVCALDKGAVTCWGESWGKDLGELSPVLPPAAPPSGGPPPHAVGHGHRVDRTPVHLQIANAVKLVGGGRQTCALDRDGAAWCWESDRGLNPAVTKKTFCKGPIVDLALGGEECGQQRDGTVCCVDLYGPIDTAPLRGASQLQISGFHVCGLVDHALRCVGRGGADATSLFR